MLGYVEGKNLALDVRRAEGDYARVPALAAELVSSTPHVIVGITANVVAALHRATSSIPIVIAISGDPVAPGFVKSLAEPGGNITGVYNQSLDLTAKSIELLHEAVPNAKRIAILRSPNVGHESMVKEANAGAGALGLVVVPVVARTPADLGDAFVTMHQNDCDALIVLADPRLDRKIVELARGSSPDPVQRMPCRHHLVSALTFAYLPSTTTHGPIFSTMMLIDEVAELPDVPGRPRQARVVRRAFRCSPT